MVGNLYLGKGDLEGARKYYTRVLQADPNFVVANANLAWVDAQEGKDLDVALGMAQKAKSLMPDQPSITDTLAWVMYKKGNYASAIPLPGVHPEVPQFGKLPLSFRNDPGSGRSEVERPKPA